MIFDFRVFIGESFDGKSQLVEDLLVNMDDLKIDMALACPFKPLSYDFDAANQELSKSLKNYEDRLLGAARIDPWQPDAPQSLVHAVEDLGMRALYINPWEENFRADIARLDSLMVVAGEKKIPVTIASGYPWLSEASQVSKLATRWPQVQIVMTNGGQINISGLGQAGAALALSQQANLSFDTAGIYRQDFIDEFVDEFCGERVFFASGAPYFYQRYEIKRVQMASIKDEYRQKVAGKNALALFGIVNT
ncbi:MAG: amidohydrolase family protein [Anaerolineales bacterium]|jgi:predicted TIM-barrel fold metal-dependent hydrolase